MASMWSMSSTCFANVWACTNLMVALKRKLCSPWYLTRFNRIGNNLSNDFVHCICYSTFKVPESNFEVFGMLRSILNSYIMHYYAPSLCSFSIAWCLSSFFPLPVPCHFSRIVRFGGTWKHVTISPASRVPWHCFLHWVLSLCLTFSLTIPEFSFPRFLSLRKAQNLSSFVL